ncbi:MAG: 50S ribosomal protein L4 [Thermoleophilia bacterium]
MAGVNAPLLSAEGTRAEDVALADEVFAAEIKQHLLHEVVRAEANAARAGTRGAKTRGQVAGGRAKPWRQKGTGRARQGTIRAPQFAGGGVAFPPTMRSFELKVNKKVRRSALRGALSYHVARQSLAVVDGASFAEPSTKKAAAFLAGWGVSQPLLVVCALDEEAVAKSFRNLDRAIVLPATELEVSALVWARSVLFTKAALDHVQKVAAA